MYERFQARNMNKLNPVLLLVFIVVLIAVVACIYFTREQWWSIVAQRQQQQQPEIQAQIAASRAAADAIVEHANYMWRYLDSNYARTPGMKTIAVVAMSDDGTWNSAVGTALADRFKSKSVETLPSFFKMEFVSDGLFNHAIIGVSDLSKKLELGKFVDGLLLAREKVSYSTNPPALESLITANMQLEVVMLAVTTNGQNQRWTFTAKGTDFKEYDARTMAENRIIKQITDDTKISLGNIP